eukprot:3260020-Rhodomonas_salina.1
MKAERSIAEGGREEEGVEGGENGRRGRCTGGERELEKGRAERAEGGRRSRVYYQERTPK